jgi:hypothetical protein
LEIRNSTRPIAKQRTHATMEELLEAMFSTRSFPRCYKQDSLMESVNLS